MPFDKRKVTKKKRTRKLGAGRDEVRFPAAGEALAVEHRLPIPNDTRSVLASPYATLWGNALPALQTLVEDENAVIKPVIEVLETVCFGE